MDDEAPEWWADERANLIAEKYRLRERITRLERVVEAARAIRAFGYKWANNGRSTDGYMPQLTHEECMELSGLIFDVALRLDAIDAASPAEDPQ